MTTDHPQTSPEASPQAGMENPSGTEKPEMCCDGKQTAEEHRHNSPDGKCCIDT